MKGIHIFRVRGEKARLADFELLVMLLSALEWRKNNGNISLITDNAGYEYLKNSGVLTAYNSVENYLDGMKTLNINEDVFWAGSKIYALSKQNAPVVVIDLDFILWQKLDFASLKRDLAVIHTEDIYEPVYPPKEFFRFKAGFSFPNWLDWSVRPCNGALVYYGSDKFLREYASFAIEFMKYADDTNDRLSYMVFAEQRFMAMQAKKSGITIRELSSLLNLFDKNQKYFTHIWGYKQKLRDNSTEAENFCQKCLKRLKYDFGDFISENHIEIIDKYNRQTEG